MANESKRFGCPEIGALLYGILSCVITAAGGLSSIGLLVYVVILITKQSSSSPDDAHPDQQAPSPNSNLTETDKATLSSDNKLDILHLYAGILAIVILLCAIAFGFCVVLVKGILKRKSNYLKAYFVFGLMEMIVLICGSAIYMALTLDYEVAGVALGFSLLYSLPLIMVWLTFRKFGSAPPYQQCTQEMVES